MLFPCTIQHFVTTRHFIFFFLSAALFLVAAVAGEAGNKTGEVVLVNLPLKIEDAIVSAVAAGSGDNEDVEEIRNSPAIRGEEFSNGKLTTPDNSGENIGYVGAGLLGAAIGAGLGAAAWSGTGSSYLGNYGSSIYPQGYNPGMYGVVNPYAPAVGYPQTYYPGYPLQASAGYRPPASASYFYPPPGPAYGDQDSFYADANKAGGGLAGYGPGISYPGYYSELLAGTAASTTPVKVTATTGSIAAGSPSSGQKKQPSSTATATGGTSGYPIDWSAVAEAYYSSSDVSSRSYPSPAQTEDDEPAAIYVSDSYPFLFDDYY